MNWAWDQTLEPSAKLVLMALADIADDDGACFPRVKTLAQKCCLGERTVRRILKRFEDSGLLSSTPRYSRIGAQLSNLFCLNMSGIPPAKLAPPSPCQNGTPAEEDLQPSQGMSAMTSGDATAEPPLEPPVNLQLQPQPVVVEISDQLIFPKQLSNDEIPHITKLLDGIQLEQAQILLDELTGVLKDGNTIRTTPVRWFRAIVERFRKGQFTPVSGLAVATARVRKSPTQAPISPGETPTSPETARKYLAAIRSRFRASDFT